MIRAIELLLLAVFTLSACGAKPPYTPLTPTEVQQLEAENAANVAKAARGCDLVKIVYPLGAHGFDIAEDFAEDDPNGIGVLLVELCIKQGLSVVEADAECAPGMTALVPGAFGEYRFNPAFVQRQTPESMIQFGRCLREQLEIEGLEAA